MERIEAGRAHCALCGEAIRPGEDAMTTPDFLADEADPFWRFSDASMHRACFLVWDRRKAFVARYNRAAPGDFQDDERWGEGDEARGEFGEAGVIIGDGPA